MIAIRILSISFLLIASASAAKAGTKDDAGGPLPAPLIDIPGKETRKSTPATETGSTDSNDKSGAVKSTTGEGLSGLLPASFKGTWRVSWQEDTSSNGPISLEMNGNNVIGRYNAADNGRLYLENRQGLLAGHWVEDSSDKECGRAYQGSRHWGKVQLRPTGNGDRYVGTWGYCDNAGTFALSIIKQGAAQAGIQDKAQPEATFAKPASGEDIRQAEIDATMEKVKAALAADAKKPTVSKPDDGTKVIYQDTGRKISRRPDGTKIIEMEDGERIITKPDGSIEKGRWK